MTTPFVQYAYANGSANTVRPTSLTYPDGRVISQDYGTADGMNDAASRVASLVDDDNTHLADYSYLGKRSFVVSDSPEPQVKWSLASLTGSNDPDTGDIYTGLDRFGRVKDNRWYDYGASADADRIKYGYGRAGNRVWRQNTVAEALSKPFDEVYGNDLIHRLKDLSRGILNGNKDAVTDLSFGECWSLDATGNWQGFRQDDDGDGNWDLIQARTANTVNEITGVSESTGPSWATPAYNAAGNMTTVPQPGDPTKTYTATYDAWNRLVKLVDEDTSDTVAEYQYDGANRRTVQKSYVGGVLDETRHLYYTQPSQWQVVEERVDAETEPDRQFVWGQRYIDDLVLRDRDTNTNGTLDERLYALQDANWNVTALIDASGDVLERFAYAAYGTPLFLSSAFVQQGSTSFDWETLYAGYRWETLTELFHVRHRVLNSALGTWLQRDPILRRSSTGLYLYGDSGPLVTLDPSGTLVFVLLLGVSGSTLLKFGGVLVIGAGLIWLLQEPIGCTYVNVVHQTLGDLNTCSCQELCDFRDSFVDALSRLRADRDLCDAPNRIGVNHDRLDEYLGDLAANGFVAVGEHLYGVTPAGEAHPKCVQTLIDWYFETDRFGRDYGHSDVAGHPSPGSTQTSEGVCLWIRAETRRNEIAVDALHQLTADLGCNC